VLSEYQQMQRDNKNYILIGLIALREAEVFELLAEY